MEGPVKNQGETRIAKTKKDGSQSLFLLFIHLFIYRIQ